jgi:hypothetical protein
MVKTLCLAFICALCAAGCSGSLSKSHASPFPAAGDVFPNHAAAGQTFDIAPAVHFIRPIPATVHYLWDFGNWATVAAGEAAGQAAAVTEQDGTLKVALAASQAPGSYTLKLRVVLGGEPVATWQDYNIPFTVEPARSTASR